MKNLYFTVTHHLQKYILFVLFIALLSDVLSALIPMKISAKLPAFPKPVLCRAATILPGLNTTVENAVPLSRETIYEDTIETDATHYYCLFGQEHADNIRITLTANTIPSLSFQIFDGTGAVCPPASYQYKPSSQTIEINYFFAAAENYLLSLHNLLSDPITYRITYTSLPTDTKQDKGSAARPKATPKPEKNRKTKKTQTTSKPRKRKQPQTTLKPQAIQKEKPLPKPTITPKPEYSAKTKKKQKTEIKKLRLSKTFIHVSPGKSFSLRAYFMPKNGTASCQWIVSDSSILTEKKERKVHNGSVLTARIRKKGTVIITCRIIGRKKLSASCTVKTA